MTSTRRTAIVAGVFFLLTEVTAIGGVLLYGSVLGTPDFIISSSADNTGVLGGAFLEVLLAIAVVGTAVTLYPVIKRQHEGIALGYVAGRLIEAIDHRRRRDQPARCRHDAAGPRRNDRCRGDGCCDRRPVTGGRARLDLPLRAETGLGREHRAAGVPDVPLSASAPRHRSARARRWLTHLRVGHCGPVRPVRGPVDYRCDCGRSGLRLGGQRGRLDDRQGVPGLLPGARRGSPAATPTIAAVPAYMAPRLIVAHHHINHHMW